MLEVLAAVKAVSSGATSSEDNEKSSSKTEDIIDHFYHTSAHLIEKDVRVCTINSKGILFV